MRLYTIKSPSGQTVKIWAESIHHAIQLATMHEGWKYTATQYYQYNHIRV